MMRALLPLIGLGLVACAVSDQNQMADFKTQAIEASPLVREIAASNRFFFCKDHPQPDRFVAICEVCNVDFYPDKDLPFNADPDTEAPIIGVKGWATHFYHEFKPRDGDPKPRITVTGERATQRFETSDLTVEAIETLFASANEWCEARGAGEYRLLKNEISAFVEGLSS